LAIPEQSSAPDFRSVVVETRAKPVGKEFADVGPAQKAPTHPQSALTKWQESPPNRAALTTDSVHSTAWQEFSSVCCCAAGTIEDPDTTLVINGPIP